MRKSALFAVIALAPLLVANSPGTLDVTISGIKNRNGQLLVCLWNGKPGFPTCGKSKTAAKIRSAITGNTMKVTFRNVAPGSYAVSAEHDEDGDGKLKTNFIGMPKEGVGISNNPGGIPGWSKSQITVTGNGAIAITLRYL